MIYALLLLRDFLIFFRKAILRLLFIALREVPQVFQKMSVGEFLPWRGSGWWCNRQADISVFEHIHLAM